MLQRALIVVGTVSGFGLAFALGRMSNSAESKERRLQCFLGYADTPDTLIASFKTYLQTRAPKKLKAFEDQLLASPEAALAEAAVFGILQQLTLRPEIADIPGTGGADFLCRYRPIRFMDQGSWPFVVEVTTLERTAVETNTGWPNTTPKEISGQWFNLVTKRITDRASKKIPQLARYKMPRVLAIVSSHIGASAFLSSAIAAESIIISDRQISQPLGGGQSRQVTDLRDSVFLRWNSKTGETEAQRPSISAVLLVSLSGRQSSVRGILHPEPHYPLNIDALPDVPFVKIARWPIGQSQINLDWVVGQPACRDFQHRVIS